MSWISGARALAAASLLVCLNAYAQTSTPLVDVVHTIAAATTAVPVEETLTFTTAGTYTLTLTDTGAAATPATPLAAVKLAITSASGASGAGLVTLSAPQSGGATLNSAKNQMISAGTVTFSASAGTYIIHVVGSQTLDGSGVPVPGSGPFDISVTDASGNSAGSYSGALSLPPNSSNSLGSSSDTFTVSSSGSYTVTMTDFLLPVALTEVLGVVSQQGGAVLTDANFALAPGTASNSESITLASGTPYSIATAGQADATDNAGLYGVTVADSNGNVVYSKVIPVGQVTAIGTPALTAHPYTFSIADLAFPNPLAQVGAAVTLNGQVVASLTTTNTTTFTATATTYTVYAVGIANSGSTGSYSALLQPTGGSPVLNVARGVADASSGLYAYSYDVTTVGSNTYTFDLTDFAYPGNFRMLTADAVQNGALLVSADKALSVAGTSGTLNLAPAAGTVTLLVFTQPAAATGNAASAGLFGLDLTASGAGTPAFENTQGVGTVFSQQKVAISTAGYYDVEVTDVGFPASFANLAVIVTRGTSNVGESFGSGTIGFSATAGDYFVNFITTPNSTDQAGTYAMVVEQTPPPTVTVTAAPTSVSSGSAVSLTWTSTNTTSCTASSSPAGAWSGSVGTSSSAAVTSGPLTATTTFTLTCVGTDGSTQTGVATVTVTGSSSTSGGGGKGGGGGAIQWDVLVALLGVATLRIVSWRNRQ